MPDLSLLQNERLDYPTKAHLRRIAMLIEINIVRLLICDTAYDFEPQNCGSHRHLERRRS
jgi:hypothetical protein